MEKPMEGILSNAQPRARITAEISARSGIDEPMIDRVVNRFYAKIRADALLAPILEARIADLEPHLQRILSSGLGASPQVSNSESPGLTASHRARMEEFAIIGSIFTTQESCHDVAGPEYRL